MVVVDGNEFFRGLGSPRLVCGPMVDASELAFRMLVRKYGADLAYTPMLNSKQFVSNPRMRQETFSTCQGDRPLVAQVAGDCPETLLEASRLVEGQVDAVDINFGCPQHIAKRGHYGAFLQDEWDLMRKLISTLDQNLSVPVWCKIRVFPEQERTLAYAEMIESSGCKTLAVHGRTRESKGRNAGRADWNIIADVKKAVSIPVIANGDAVTLSEAERCLEVTKCDAVMAAYPLLENPQMFMGVTKPNVLEITKEYLELAELYNTPAHQVRGHIFKLLKSRIVGYTDIIERLGVAKTVPVFSAIVGDIDDLLTSGGATQVDAFASPPHLAARPVIPAPVDVISEGGLCNIFD